MPIFVGMTARQYPENPFDRMVKVEVEDSSQGKYRFDESYPYLDTSFRYRLNRVISFILQWFLCVPWNWIKWGVRVKGRKNARGLKDGAVAVCNHVYIFDALSVYQAVRPFRPLWIPMYAKHFNGSNGWVLRHIGGIPVPETAGGMHKFIEAFDHFHRRKDWTLVFPEEVRWDYYPYLRPFRKGAFSMAHKYGIPIVPCVITFRERKGWRKLFGKQDEPLISIEVGRPIQPDPAMGRNDDVDRLRLLAHSAMLKMAGIESNPWPAIP